MMVTAGFSDLELYCPNCNAKGHLTLRLTDLDCVVCTAVNCGNVVSLRDQAEDAGGDWAELAAAVERWVLSEATRR